MRMVRTLVKSSSAICAVTQIPAYHKEVLDQGVRIGFDRFGIQVLVGAPFDHERVATLMAIIDEGYEDQILLAHDSVNIWLWRVPVMNEQVSQIMGNWHPAHIFENILPMLRENGVTENKIDKLLGVNAISLFAGAPTKVK